MSKYTSQDRIEAFLNRPLTENELILLDESIEHISEYIEAYTGRSWTSIECIDSDEDPEPEVRFFSGNGNKELYIDDFTGLEYVKILDSQGSQALKYEEESDYILSPANKTIKRSIFLRNFHFPQGINNIEISAIWGGGEPPKGIIMVATNLVGKYMQKFSSNNSSFKKESIEGYSYEIVSGKDIDSDVEGLLATLDAYRKISL